MRDTESFLGWLELYVLLQLCWDAQRKSLPSPRPNSYCLPTASLGALVDTGKCKAINSDQAICDGMVVRFACIKVK